MKQKVEVVQQSIGEEVYIAASETLDLDEHVLGSPKIYAELERRICDIMLSHDWIPKNEAPNWASSHQTFP